MMKSSILMLLAAWSVHCNVVSRYNEKDIFNTDSNVALDIIKKSQDHAQTGSNSPKIQRLEPADCADLLMMGHNKSGTYRISPISNPVTFKIMEGMSFDVYCDMDTNGGGWTVIQRRGDFSRPKDYFYRIWEDYKKGFGNIKEDFWLGNDKIFALTNQKLYSVRFDLRDVDKYNRYAVYDEFWIDDEKRNYTLHINRNSGNAGNSMIAHNYQPFSTFDHDNSVKCAEKRKGGWWFHSNCTPFVNLNGYYYKGKNGNTNADGTSWSSWKGDHESLEWTEIKIRPKYFRATFS